MLRPELRRQAREVVFVVILNLAVWAKRILVVATVLDLAIFTVHDERNTVFDGHVQGKIRLSVDERLERIAQMSEREIRQPAGHLAIGRAEHVVETRTDERIQIATADFGRPQWRPRYREWIHAVTVFELMRNEAAV